MTETKILERIKSKKYKKEIEEENKRKRLPPIPSTKLIDTKKHYNRKKYKIIDFLLI